MGQETIIASLVQRCIDWSESEQGAIPFESICSEHPELTDEVRQAVRVSGLLPVADRALLRRGPQPGDLIAGRYRVERYIGEGGMGLVVAVTDLDLGRPAAIKLMRSDLLASTDSLERFEREATSLAAVSHPGVVVIYDRGVTEESLPFLVMELVDGVSFAEVIERSKERGGLEADTTWLIEEFGLEGVRESSFIRQVTRWTLEVASGLVAAHTQGIVHRDIKPTNILIRRDGRAVLIDFGIAGSEDHRRVTRTGHLVGTPAYMAPEALEGQTRVDAQSDVYGLAATLYHVLTGEPPYTGSAPEILAALATREPTPPGVLQPNLSPDARAILEHGLARRKKDRYQGITALEQDLRAFLEHRPISVRPTSGFQRWLRRARTSRRLQGGLVGVVLAGAVLGMVAMERRNEARKLAEYKELWPTIPANVGIAPFSRYLDSEVREQVGLSLDRLVELGQDPLVAHSLRGLYWIGQGDPTRGLADFDVAARVAGTPYAQALADGLKTALGDHRLIDFTSFGEPLTDDDVYLALLHESRHGALLEFEDPAAILTALKRSEDESARAHRHGAEIGLQFDAVNVGRLIRKGTYPAARQAHGRLAEAGAELSTRDGFEGANQLQAVAASLMRLGRYSEALVVTDRLLEAAPHSPGAELNAATCLYELQQYEAALDRATRVETLIGATPKQVVVKAKILAALGRYDEASEQAGRLHLGDSEHAEWITFNTQFQVGHQRAARAYRKSKELGARIAAEVLTAVEASRFKRRIRGVDRDRLLALVNQDDARIFRSFCEELQAKPGSLRLLILAAKFRPTPFDTESADLFGSFLDELPNLVDQLPLFSGR